MESAKAVTTVPNQPDQKILKWLEKANKICL